MIYLHNNNDPLGQKIKDRLLVESIAHKEVNVEGEESFLRENDHKIVGELAIFRFLDALSRDLDYSRSLGADACIMDNRNGSIC